VAQAWLIRVESSAAWADMEAEANRAIAAAPTIKADTLGRRFSICCLPCVSTPSMPRDMLTPDCERPGPGPAGSHRGTRPPMSKIVGIPEMTWPLLASLARSCVYSRNRSSCAGGLPALSPDIDGPFDERDFAPVMRPSRFPRPSTWSSQAARTEPTRIPIEDRIGSTGDHPIIPRTRMARSGAANHVASIAISGRRYQRCDGLNCLHHFAASLMIGQGMSPKKGQRRPSLRPQGSRRR
jgi:hypothetical protein